NVLNSDHANVPEKAARSDKVVLVLWSLRSREAQFPTSVPLNRRATSRFFAPLNPTWMFELVQDFPRGSQSVFERQHRNKRTVRPRHRFFIITWNKTARR